MPRNKGRRRQGRRRRPAKINKKGCVLIGGAIGEKCGIELCIILGRAESKKRKTISATGKNEKFFDCTILESFVLDSLQKASAARRCPAKGFGCHGRESKTCFHIRRRTSNGLAPRRSVVAAKKWDPEKWANFPSMSAGCTPQSEPNGATQKMREPVNKPLSSLGRMMLSGRGNRPGRVSSYE